MSGMYCEGLIYPKITKVINLCFYLRQCLAPNLNSEWSPLLGKKWRNFDSFVYWYEFEFSPKVGFTQIWYKKLSLIFIRNKLLNQKKTSYKNYFCNLVSGTMRQKSGIYLSIHDIFPCYVCLSTKWGWQSVCWTNCGGHPEGC